LLKKNIVVILVAVLVVAAIIPIGYGIIQRMAVSSLTLHFKSAELANVDFSQTQTLNNIQNTYDNLQNPSEGLLSQALSITSSIPSEQTIFMDLLVNTKYTFNVYLDISNPSSIPVIIDRNQIKVSISGHELPNDVTLSQQVTIPAGGSTTVQLQGITASGKDIASVLYNSFRNDYALDFNFGITSYYPTLFGEIPYSSNIHLITYPIPPKPSFTNLQQAGYNTNSYTLSFQNSNNFPIDGHMQVGVLKGNSFGCDPACFAPIDNGFATFLRIKGSDVFGIQVYDTGYTLSPSQTFTMEIQNPNLRNSANSAFVIRWAPSFDTIPYTATVDVSGVSKSYNGEFHSSAFSTVRNVVYDFGRDFGYVGSREFVSPNFGNQEVQTSGNQQSLNSEVTGTVPTLQNLVKTLTTSPSQPQVQAQGSTVANSIYTVLPGTYRYISFTANCLGTLTGGFSSQALLGNDIIVYLLNQNGFNQFQSGHSAPTYYNSGKIGSGRINVSLYPGTYYLIMSNTYSLVSIKTVTLQAYYTCISNPGTNTYQSSSSSNQQYQSNSIQNQQNNQISITSGAGASASADCVSAQNCFHPNPLSISPGITVTWTNTDQLSHTITSGRSSDDTTGTLFDSGLVNPGRTFQFTFTNSGTYDYFCTIHPWLTGQVVVSR